MVAATAAAPSAIDALVNRLPAQAPATATPAPAPAAAPRAVAAAARTPTGAEAYRYRVADSAKPGSADNFDRWMRDNNVRVATGKPATPVVTAAGRQSLEAGRQSDKPSAAGRPTAIAAAAAPVTAPAPATLSQQVLGNVLLQVASFASRDNATRAQGQLTAAGIVGATISDIAAGGRTLWRLRVPANDHANATELAGRIAGLGFGAPQIVKE
jgi:rare lipoprotein A